MIDWTAIGKDANYTTVYRALGGWQSVLVDGKTNEPISTGLGPFGQDYNKAVLDARQIANEEGVLCKAKIRETKKVQKWRKRKQR